MSLWCAERPLVLASRSASRRRLLEDAGIPVEVCVPSVDERAVETAAGQPPPERAALVLAREKARAGGHLLPGRIVVGADQTLAFDGEQLNKPVDDVMARRQLAMLSGNTHFLHSAVAVAVGDDIVFDAVDTARLKMRPLSGAFLDHYVETAGAAVVTSVGAYQLENLGIHLFEEIDGNYFTILGLPLLPLFDHFRRSGCLMA